MQDRYVGDIGDYAKYALLRALSPGHKLGVGWYLFPDENHNGDGRHTTYLDAPALWRAGDPELFDALSALKATRTVRAVELAAILPGAVFSSRLLSAGELRQEKRPAWRREWFVSTMEELRDCDMVFADPDNGLCEDARFRPGRVKDWKRLPRSEALELSEGRTAILYHHNTRRAGGHVAEIRYWMEQIGRPCLALRWRPYSPRTFFIVNPTPIVISRATEFAARWRGRFELIAE